MHGSPITSIPARKPVAEATASAAVVVAATDDGNSASRVTAPAGSAGALLAAALALPGVMPASALAQTAPDQGLIALKYVDYRDWQPGGDRIHVHSPSLYLLKPVSDSLAAEGSLVYDGISGASPLYHNTLSGASGKGGVTDYRTAGDVKLTNTSTAPRSASAPRSRPNAIIFLARFHWTSGYRATIAIVPTRSASAARATTSTARTASPKASTGALSTCCSA
jgi:Protein of unknown function (DUF3570).